MDIQHIDVEEKSPAEENNNNNSSSYDLKTPTAQDSGELEIAKTSSLPTSIETATNKVKNNFQERINKRRSNDIY